jgi:hypothetical protein
MLLNAAYLIPREETAAFKRAFYQLKDSNPFLKFLLSGPWPPYNFVSVALQPPSLDPSPLLNAISQAAASSLCHLTAKGALS